MLKKFETTVIKWRLETDHAAGTGTKEISKCQKSAIQHFVKALSEDTTDKTSKELCEDYVHVRIIIIDGETDFLKGFWFVDLNSEKDAKVAREAMEDEIDGNKAPWTRPSLKVMVCLQALKRQKRKRHILWQRHKRLRRLMDPLR